MPTAKHSSYILYNLPYKNALYEQIFYILRHFFVFCFNQSFVFFVHFLFSLVCQCVEFLIKEKCFYYFYFFFVFFKIYALFSFIFRALMLSGNKIPQRISTDSTLDLICMYNKEKLLSLMLLLNIVLNVNVFILDVSLFTLTFIHVFFFL